MGGDNFEEEVNLPLGEIKEQRDGYEIKENSFMEDDGVWTSRLDKQLMKHLEKRVR